MRLQEYTFSIEYLKGKDNTVADALSRIPWFLVDPHGVLVSTPSAEYHFSSSDSDEDAPHLVGLDSEIPEISAPTMATDKILTLNEFKIAQNSDSTLTTVTEWVKKNVQPTLEEISSFLTL